MTDLAFFLAGFLCCALLVFAVWAIRFLMAPPPGHHIAVRGGKRIVRRNPKRTSPSNAKPAHGFGPSSDLSTSMDNDAALGSDAGAAS